MRVAAGVFPADAKKRVVIRSDGLQTRGNLEVEGVSMEGQVLTLSTGEALRLGVADAQMSSVDELVESLPIAYARGNKAGDGLAKDLEKELFEMMSRCAEELVTRGADVFGDPPADVLEGTVGCGRPDLEREAIVAALKEVGGNRRKAAEMLEMGERTLYRKIKEYGIPL